jgi:predicted PolB exonuclease-like 3'-5' exonuclease
MSGTILPAKHYNLELGREKDSKRNKEEDYIKIYREKKIEH